MTKDNLSGIKFYFGKDKLVGYVSPEDIDLVSLSWGKSNGYAMGCRKNGYLGKMMHRVILERILNRKLRRSEFVDHINRKRSDNRRHNLRLSDSSKNQLNRIHPRKSVSGYKGVHFDSCAFKKDWKKCYKSSIVVRGKAIFLGLYDNPKKAALAYDKAAKKYFGELAETNF